MSDDKKYEYEDTPEIEIADNNVGNLLKVITAVLVTICLIYFYIYRIDPAKKKIEKPAVTKPAKTPKK